MAYLIKIYILEGRKQDYRYGKRVTFIFKVGKKRLFKNKAPHRRHQARSAYRYMSGYVEMKMQTLWGSLSTSTLRRDRRSWYLLLSSTCGGEIINTHRFSELKKHVSVIYATVILSSRLYILRKNIRAIKIL